jgi:hypothetical protein
METIFFLSAHCGKGPIFAAGSVFVKSGLQRISSRSGETTSLPAFLEAPTKVAETVQIIPMIYLDFMTGNSKGIINRVRATVS